MGQGGGGPCRARLPPLFDKYGDKQTRNFVRARYKKDLKTKELTTDPKTRALELFLVKETESSSAGSSQSTPSWDSTLSSCKSTINLQLRV